MYKNIKRFKENINNINPEKIIGDTDNNLFLRQQIAPFEFLKPPLTTGIFYSAYISKNDVIFPCVYSPSVRPISGS